LKVKQAKFLLMLFLLLTTAVLVPSSSAHELLSEKNGNQIVKESFAVEELEKYPDVKAFLIEKGFEQYLKDESHTYEVLAKRFHLQESEPSDSDSGIPSEIREEIEKRYGLEPRKPKIILYEQHFTVERSIHDRRIEAVWIETSVANRHSSSSEQVRIDRNTSASLKEKIQQHFSIQDEMKKDTGK